MNQMSIFVMLVCRAILFVSCSMVVSSCVAVLYLYVVFFHVFADTVCLDDFVHNCVSMVVSSCNVFSLCLVWLSLFMLFADVLCTVCLCAYKLL